MSRIAAAALFLLGTALPLRADDVSPALVSGVWYADIRVGRPAGHETAFRDPGSLGSRRWSGSFGGVRDRDQGGTVMNCFALAIVIGVVSIPAAVDPPKELPGETKRELKALEGKWRAVKFLHADRETTPGTDDDPFIVSVKGGRIDFAGVATAVVADLDSTTDPKCLDFKVRTGSGLLRADTVYESVYKRDGDTLTWAFYHGRGKSRPTSLDRPTDPGLMVMVLTRVKE